MTRIPPLLPETVLARVLQVARFNGMTMLAIAGFFSILSALAGDYVATLAGLIVAGAGAMEIHGGTMLTYSDSRGVSWLFSSEIVALAGILAYCGVRLVTFRFSDLPDQLKSAIAMEAHQLGLTKEQYVTVGFELIAIVSVIYQGGLAIYYARRRKAVEAALAASDDR